jgi:hypothetical protein
MSVEAFIAYSHTDDAMKQELIKHLSPLQRRGLVEVWHDRRIEPGVDWNRDIDLNLNSSNLILLLISADFIYSDYCYSVEMIRALEREARGEARVIPVILRPCDWHQLPFGRLQALPQYGKPVTTWPNRDEAYTDVVTQIRTVLEGSGSTGATPAVSRSPHAAEYKLLYRIGFDYLPASPLDSDRGWKKAYGSGEPLFRTDTDLPGSLVMEVRGGEFAMDYQVAPGTMQCDRLQFTAKLTQSTMIFTGLDVTPRDGSLRKKVWFKYYPGSRQPEPTKDAPYNKSTQLPEQTIWVPPTLIQGGWMAFDITLADEVRGTLGTQGWIYHSLWAIRLRGSLSVSAITAFSTVRH